MMIYVMSHRSVTMAGMTDDLPPESLSLARIGARQHGLLTTDQLAALGLSRWAIARRVRDGRLRRADLGVYALCGSPRTWDQVALAACLAHGPAAALSHGSAARVWQLDVPSATSIHLTVAYGRNAQLAGGGVVVHRSRSLLEGDLARAGRLPVTSVARTLIDLAGDLDADALARALDDCLSRRLLRPEVLRERVERDGGGRRGEGRLRRLLDPWLGQRSVESVGEGRFLRAFAGAGLPMPQVQYELEDLGVRVDFAWPAEWLVLEVDSFRWHANPRSYARDSLRANRLAAAGWTVLRATPAELTDGLPSLLAALRRRLGTAGGRAL